MPGVLEVRQVPGVLGREVRGVQEVRQVPGVLAREVPGVPEVLVQGVRIVAPPAGAIYSIDPTLRREFQALPLRAVSDRLTTLTWLVDGATIGTASSDRSLAWPLAVGAHEIEARDADGRRARTSVVVK